jgi:hypothetical protein
MNNRMEMPASEPEPVLPGYKDSVEESSPEFQELREKVRAEMEAKGGRIDEHWVTYMTHMRIIKNSMDAEREARRKGFSANA